MVFVKKYKDIEQGPTHKAEAEQEELPHYLSLLGLKGSFLKVLELFEEVAQNEHEKNCDGCVVDYIKALLEAFGPVFFDCVRKDFGCDPRNHG